MLFRCSGVPGFTNSLIFERFDLFSRVSITIRGSCCFRTIRCIAFVFHLKDVCFGVYFVHFKFIPELFILFLCVSILIRAPQLSFVDLQHIASVFECECLTSYNFDRNGAP